MERRGGPFRYVPFDVSEEMLRVTAASLLDRYPGLLVHGVIGDFQCHLGEIPPSSGRRVVIFLGGTIGNLDAVARQEFLTSVRHLLGPDDAFLLGVDLVKDVAVLDAAYNDSAGVTAEFNRNLLRVVNRQLAANFDPEAFRHWALYNSAEQRIEMYLVPDQLQRVRVADLDLTLEVAPNETIWTEISCKFTKASVAEMLSDAGMRLTRWYTDSHERFGLALATPALAPGAS
jgi:L-histidine N-alpha-methyltransferase